MFPLESKSDVYRIPLESVVNDVDGTFVFIANPAEQSEEAIVSRQSVTLGELTDDGMEILSGINKGDRVITAGISVLRDGQRVLLP